MTAEALTTLIISVSSLAIIGFIAGAILSFASQKFKSEADPRVSSAVRLLPGANCGACGYPGCQGFAEALLKGEANISACRLMNDAQRKELANILGVEAAKIEEKVAVLFCGAGKALCEKRGDYVGALTCSGENLAGEGSLACVNGSLALGDCFRACPFNAIELDGDKPPKIKRDKCVACGKCVTACPRSLIELTPRSHKILILCKTQHKGAEIKKICSVGCIACRICTNACPTGAITMEGRIPVIDHSKCNECGECIKTCPQNTIVKVD